MPTLWPQMKVPAALQNHGKAAAWKTSVAYVQKQSNLLLFFAPLIQSQFDLLVSGRLGPRFGPFLTPKRGPFVGKIFAVGRKNSASFDCVSAGAPQKFCIGALRQGHLASRDQLTDQEQCEAANGITTRAVPRNFVAQQRLNLAEKFLAQLILLFLLFPEALSHSKG